MSEIHIQGGEALASALQRFKRTVKQEHVINEIKRYAGHPNEGERTRLKGTMAPRRNRK